MRKKIIMGIVSVVIVVMIFLGGCTNRNNTNQQAGVLSGLKTCAELNGYACNETEDCNETWLDAVDSFRCCSCECGLAVDDSDLLLPESFDETPANEDLGEVSP